MNKRLLALFVLVVFVAAMGSAVALQAQQRVTVVGIIELEDGVPILVAKEGQIYDLEGTDLSELNKKRIEVTGTLIEGEGAPLIQIEKYRQVQ
ncbi:MAG: hypothetical protein AUK55_15140 [Syntrophobacteraceae bacterium CG2_30_61_12]|nr:MAG: hypothetical protein AUK55_15140 [Syntrophobacteraceae bacterium CG2_30_61_12]